MPRYPNALTLAALEAHNCDASTPSQLQELVRRERAGRRENAFLTRRHTTLRIAVRSFHAQHCGVAHDTLDACILRLGRCAAWVRNKMALLQALSDLHAFVLHDRVPSRLARSPPWLVEASYLRAYSRSEVRVRAFFPTPTLRYFLPVHTICQQ